MQTIKHSPGMNCRGFSVAIMLQKGNCPAKDFHTCFPGVSLILSPEMEGERVVNGILIGIQMLVSVVVGVYFYRQLIQQK